MPIAEKVIKAKNLSVLLTASGLHELCADIICTSKSGNEKTKIWRGKTENSPGPEESSSSIRAKQICSPAAVRLNTILDLLRERRKIRIIIRDTSARDTRYVV
ncbi:hypothetical protein ATANTOWER_012053 [Ataeniobius toweri]|uniref:Uncharacterized protein n=1 Tax=Ataeniobius toweri TaxID=208326 RepID=A0ABU7A5T4_9TELE|nr:hypothetical protein [Ataeniobius toweri]